MKSLLAKLALEVMEKYDELVNLNPAETLDVLRDHVRLFGFKYALVLTLTKEQ